MKSIIRAMVTVIFGAFFVSSVSVASIAVDDRAATESHSRPRGYEPQPVRRITS